MAQAVIDKLTKKRIVEKAFLIRHVEERLLSLYRENKVSGTIHTCIGQEFTGVVIAEFLKPGDSIFSNHRCHGHFLSIHDDVTGLIAEIMGKNKGVCGGRGGSQHLCRSGFYSNGIQGGTTPIACGMAFARKLRENQNIAVVFIGDGTLGEGLVYEAFNISAKWELPILFVLENNGYSQSTKQEETLAGGICVRAEAFGIKTEKSDTWNLDGFYITAKNLINEIRSQRRPGFLQIDTFRLNSHSTSDDYRPGELLETYRAKDPLNIIMETIDPELNATIRGIEERIDSAVDEAEKSPAAATVTADSGGEHRSVSWHRYTPPEGRIVQRLNNTFAELFDRHDDLLFIGEDVRDPYGGAFKVSKGLSSRFPNRVINTPISESAIVGVGTGLAMEGYRPIVEIMFGDFIPLAFDQIVNHASKFHYMYDDQVQLNLIIRTPMGGGRGYGPTHSQTLDKHFYGIPGLQIVALNHLIAPDRIYLTAVENQCGCLLVIENKLLYSEFLCAQPPEGFDLFLSDEKYPCAILKPQTDKIDVTLFGYGGMSSALVKTAELLFQEYDIISQVICPSQIYPLNLKHLMPLINESDTLVTVEEGQGFAGFGAEVIAQFCESTAFRHTRVIRCYPPATPIPAAIDLERAMLPSVDTIISTILPDERSILRN